MIMCPYEKGLLIKETAILMKESVRKENKAFDSSKFILDLVFASDDDVKRIASLAKML